MEKLILTGLLAIGVLLCTGCNTNDSIKKAADKSVQQFEQAGIQNMENDALFAAEAASASLLQVELGEKALERGTSPEVKTLAQRMVNDHQRIHEDLRAMASATNLVLPGTLGQAHEDLLKKVTDQSGIAFDLAYIKTVAEQHQNLLDRYQDMSENGTNMKVKMFASQQLPLLRQHQEMIDKLQEKVEGV
ncbi:DUF4142 domain-containing protein [Pontibacter vulgaris]|uniref:DUF4142 domain-containing protein n=1 Tax=Pontibacter vulgaris TaxID=2905679 RepID=UPI001FA6E3E5|nr:DUF4142 domain-containing protein [Pontibacter vulgaris]